MQLAPVVQVAGPPGPLVRVKLPPDRHHVVAHAQGPAGEAALPARVSVWQPDAGHHIPPAEKNDNKDAETLQIIIQLSLSSEVHEGARHLLDSLQASVLFTKSFCLIG